MPVWMRPGISILLEEQDRRRWNQQQIAEALPLVEEALRGEPGPFALQAAIAAVHCQAARAEDTDWPQIVRLYDLLERLQPSPIVSLNRAVAVAMVDGPQPALALIDALAAAGELETITCCMPHAPICCVVSDPQQKRLKATRERWRWSPTTASADFSSGGCAKFSPQEGPPFSSEKETRRRISRSVSCRYLILPLFFEESPASRRRQLEHRQASPEQPFAGPREWFPPTCDETAEQPRRVAAHQILHQRDWSLP